MKPHTHTVESSTEVKKAIWGLTTTTYKCACGATKVVDRFSGGNFVHRPWSDQSGPIKG